MTNQDIIDRLIDAWNRRAVADVLRLMDPQASYHDAFWGETCFGRDLVRYFDTHFSHEALWYEQDGDLIELPNGAVFRYLAYDRQHPRRRRLVYRGAEVVNLRNGLITGISDFYCDPDPVQLAEMAMQIERRRGESKIAELGLSEKTSGFIKRRLTELGNNTTVFLEPSLSPRQLADRIGCTVAHLVHVLEAELGTSFPDYVRARRVNVAATLVADGAGDTFSLEHIAAQSGFDEVEALEDAFRAVYGVSVAEYRARSDGRGASLLEELGADTARSGCYRI